MDRADLRLISNAGSTIYDYAVHEMYVEGLRAIRFGTSIHTSPWALDAYGRFCEARDLLNASLGGVKP